MKRKPRNRIQEHAERNSFRLGDDCLENNPDESQSTSKDKHLNAFRSSINERTLKGSRKKEPAIE